MGCFIPYDGFDMVLSSRGGWSIIIPLVVVVVVLDVFVVVRICCRINRRAPALLLLLLVVVVVAVLDGTGDMGAGTIVCVDDRSVGGRNWVAAMVVCRAE